MPFALLVLVCFSQLSFEDPVRASNRLGAERFAVGDFVGAVQVFDEALRRDPACNLVRTNLVIACLHAGRLEEARHHLDYLRNLGGDDPYTHYLTGVLLMRRGAADEAAAHFEAVLRRDCRDSATLTQLGLTRFHRGLYSAAAVLLRRAVELDPSDSAALYNLSRVLLMLDRREEASAALERFRRVKSGRADKIVGGMGDAVLIPGKYARIRCLGDDETP